MIYPDSLDELQAEASLSLNRDRIGLLPRYHTRALPGGGFYNGIRTCGCAYNASTIYDLQPATSTDIVSMWTRFVDKRTRGTDACIAHPARQIRVCDPLQLGIACRHLGRVVRFLPEIAGSEGESEVLQRPARPQTQTLSHGMVIQLCRVQLPPNIVSARRASSHRVQILVTKAQ
jgi:hypothetical protein